jgi:hypothetical protein
MVFAAEEASYLLDIFVQNIARAYFCSLSLLRASIAVESPAAPLVVCAQYSSGDWLAIEKYCFYRVVRRNVREWIVFE